MAVYELVPGDALDEWDEPATAAMVDVLAVIRERLAGPPLPGASRYADAFAPMLGAWRSLARRPGGDPSTVAHLHRMEVPVPIAVALLADLEEEWLDALGPGEAMQHGGPTAGQRHQAHRQRPATAVGACAGHVSNTAGVIDLLVAARMARRPPARPSPT